MENALTVSQLVAMVRQDLEAKYRSVTLVAEVSSFKPWRSGHWYFDLKDEGALVPAVMFKGFCDKVKFDIADGLQVLVRGRVSVYAPQSKIQIVVEQIEPVGAGALALAFEQLKEKLQKEGLFDTNHKVKLPFFPKRLGLVTSPQGAALQDMLRILRHRMPGLEILLAPARVQGSGAAQELAQALERLDQTGGCDAIIIGRGGGSLEDLWAFNEEILARAIYTCKTPIISAVGHETDFTIADFVADIRCATPTHAAQTVVPDIKDLIEKLDSLSHKFHKLAKAALSKAQLALAQKAKRLFSPKATLLQVMQRLDMTSQRLEKTMLKRLQIAKDAWQMPAKRLDKAVQTRLQNARERFGVAAARLEALSPLKVLSRGYGAVLKTGKAVSKIAGVKVGDPLQIRLSDGFLGVEVKEKHGI